MKATIRKWGKSLALRLPKVYADDAGLTENSPVELTIEGDRITIVPISTRRQRQRKPLEEYLGKINTENIHNETDSGALQGNEQI